LQDLSLFITDPQNANIGCPLQKALKHGFSSPDDSLALCIFKNLLIISKSARLASKTGNAHVTRQQAANPKAFELLRHEMFSPSLKPLAIQANACSRASKMRTRKVNQSLQISTHYVAIRFF
jgi:hypothetical protein